MEAKATVKFYAYISSSWVELDDVANSDGVTGNWGNGDNNPTSLLADVGQLSLMLNNENGQYSPNGPSALAGWKKGLPFKMVATFEGEEFLRYRGSITEIDAGPHNKNPKCKITVSEWLDQAARYPIVNPGIQTNKRGDEVITTINGLIPVALQATDLDTGAETFETAFDAVTGTTKAYDEYARIALSEIGHVYLKHDKTYGETLVFESSDARHGWRTPDLVPVAKSNSGFLLKEDGGYLLKEDGGKIVLNKAAAQTFDSSIITDFEAPYGQHVINRMTCYANPRRLSTSSDLLTVKVPIGFVCEMSSTYPTQTFVNGTDFAVGELNTEATIVRSWIKPNFADLPSSGIRLVSAKLVLTPTIDRSSNARTLSVHRCLRSVVGSQVTWNVYSTGNSWGTGGASNSSSDYDGSIVMGSYAIPADPTLNIPIELTFATAGIAELQKMIDGTYTNNGIVVFTSTQTDDGVYYGSINNAALDYRPYFVITYYKEVLFQLDKEIVIGSGQTVTIKGSYADPNGGNPINAQDMLTPSITKDYLMYTGSGGTGTNISSDLALTSIVYGTEGFTHQVTNNNVSTGYLYKYNCRGTGIFKYNPIQHAATNSASINEYGSENETINQAYKSTLYSGRVFVDSVVDEHNQPRTVLNSITFYANRSAACMMAFLHGDIGQMYYISIPEAGIAGNYYIKGIEFQMNGGVIMVRWIVVLALSLQVGLSAISVEFTGGASKNAIVYSAIPKIINLDQRSYSVWVYRPTGGGGTIMGAYNDGAGFQIYCGTQLAIASKLFSTFGNWLTVDGVLTANTWKHVVVTFDADGGNSTVPIVYINGSEVSITEASSPGGTRVLEDGLPFIIGNNKTATQDYNSPLTGKLFDPRIYNRILTEDEAAAIYNNGTQDETAGTKDGLVFQGFNVRTENLADYVDQTLTSALTVRDNIFGVVGTPNGSPTGRTAP